MTYATAKATKRAQSAAEKYLRQHPDRKAIAEALTTFADEIGNADVALQESCWHAAELFTGPAPGRSA